MTWLRKLAAAVRALLTVESKIKDLRWRRIEHGEDPFTDDR